MTSIISFSQENASQENHKQLDVTGTMVGTAILFSSWPAGWSGSGQCHSASNAPGQPAVTKGWSSFYVDFDHNLINKQAFYAPNAT